LIELRDRPKRLRRLDAASNRINQQFDIDPDRSPVGTKGTDNEWTARQAIPRPRFEVLNLANRHAQSSCNVGGGHTRRIARFN
jgi:hypothetical protein